MDRRLNLALDIDNTTSDSAPRILEEINRKYGTELTIDDIKEWYAKFHHNGEVIDYTKELFKLLDSPEFLTSIKPMSGAKEGIKQLQDAGHKPYFLTGRSEKTHGKGTDKWVEDNFPEMRVTYAPEGKQHHVKNFDLLFDDSGEEARKVTLAGKPAVIHDRPWNRDVKPMIARRVADWKGFNKLVEDNDY